MTDLSKEALIAALGNCINLLDGLVAESGRGVEWGEEDAFRMGEWFDDHDLNMIAAARSLATQPQIDALAAVLREARAEVWEEAAKIMQRWGDDAPQTGTYMASELRAAAREEALQRLADLGQEWDAEREGGE